MALVLAACGDGGEPAAAPAVSAEPAVTATPEPTEPPPVAAPVLPDAAKEPTPEGASAFVRYYWATADYASLTGNTAVLEQVSDDECGACRDLTSAIANTYRDGSRIEGGEATLSELTLTPGGIATDGLYFRMLLTQNATRIIAKDGTVMGQSPTVEDFLMGFLVRWDETAWTTLEWGADTVG